MALAVLFFSSVPVEAAKRVHPSFFNSVEVRSSNLKPFKKWRAAVKKAREWLVKENESRLKAGVPRKVIIGLGGIIAKVAPGVRGPPGGPPGYTMEDVEDQLKNAVSVYYRSKGKAKPRFNVVWFIGEDENPSIRIEAHLKQQTKRNRGKLKVLKGMVGLKNVTGG